jgi:hypothetical protein
MNIAAIVRSFIGLFAIPASSAEALTPSRKTDYPLWMG